MKPNKKSNRQNKPVLTGKWGMSLYSIEIGSVIRLARPPSPDPQIIPIVGLIDTFVCKYLTDSSISSCVMLKRWEKKLEKIKKQSKKTKQKKNKFPTDDYHHLILVNENFDSDDDYDLNFDDDYDDYVWIWLAI